MRKVIVAATLALSPILLHAQANSPAQPRSSSGAPTLQSSLAQPGEFLTSSATATGSTTTTAAPLRVSGGVVAPKLIHAINIESDRSSAWATAGFERTAVVGMIVDETGKPTDLTIIRSLGPEMDRNVLKAVNQYRFKPGTLSNQPTEVPVNLEIVVRSTVR